MTTTAADGPRVYSLGQTTHRSLLGRREPGEVVVLCLGIATGVLFAIASGGQPIGFVLLAASILTALTVVFVPLRGRTLYRWLPLDVRHARKKRAGTLSYRSGSYEAGFLLDGTPVDVPPPSPVGPVKWMSIPFRGEPLAVLLSQTDGALTATIEVEGPGHGLFDGPELEASHARWGSLLRELANSEGFLDRVAQITRTSPSRSSSHAAWVDGRPDAGIPTELIQSYADLQVRVTTSTDSHRNYVVCVVTELVPTDVAMREALSDLTHETAERRRSEKAGEVDDPRRLVQAGTMNQRAADVAQGAAGARIVAYVSVSAAAPTRWRAPSAGCEPPPHARGSPWNGATRSTTGPSSTFCRWDGGCDDNRPTRTGAARPTGRRPHRRQPG